MANYSPATDAELTAAYRAGCPNAAAAILKRHDGIIKYAIMKSRFPVSVDEADLHQAGRIALLAAAGADHDDSITRWTTFATTCVRRAIWKEIKRQTRCQATPCDIGTLNSIESRMEHEDADAMIEKVTRDNPSDAGVLIRLIKHEMSVSEIARSTFQSEDSVYQSLSRCHNVLRN